MMPAMSPFIITLVLVSAVQAYVDDHVSLLQASVEAAKQLGGDVPEEVADYDLATTLACASKEVPVPKVPVAVIERAPASALGPIRLTPGSDLEEPAGANTLRAVLELMIIVVIFDGMRRWHSQKQHLHQQMQQTILKQSVAKAEAAVQEAEKAAWLALVNAASAGDEANFEKALKSNPPVAQTDTWGCTPLHFAAAGGSVAIAAELLRRGVEVDALDASEETPLHFAARAGHGPLCELLLGAGAKIDAINEQDMTPFVVAGHANQESSCSLLADRNAGVAGMMDEELPALVQIQILRKVFATCTTPCTTE